MRRRRAPLKVQDSAGSPETLKKKVRFSSCRLCEGLVLQGLLSRVSWEEARMQDGDKRRLFPESCILRARINYVITRNP